MAGEYQVTLQIVASSGGISQTIFPGVLSLDATTTGEIGNPGVVSVGTSEENISFGDMTGPKYVYIQNLDSTNFVEFGKDDSSTMKELIKVPAGEIAFFPLADGETIRAKADTAACKCLIIGMG